MQRPTQKEYAPYFGTYINLVPDGDILKLLESTHIETQSILQKIAPALGNYRYAPDKWSIKELLQHMLDTERIMNYRALRFARMDNTELPGFDQDDYVSILNMDNYPLRVFVEDWEILRANTIRMFKRFSEVEFTRSGKASGNIFSVRALAYINVGHELHHRKVLVERYL